MPAKSRWSARRVVLGLILALPFALFAAPVASASAALVMSAPLSASATNATPTFKGSTSELTEPVTVRVYAGTTVGETPVETLPTGAPLESENWSVTATPLTEGTYTAVAEQVEAGGIEPPMKTAPVTFAVVTSPPVVTLEAPVSPSKNTKPTFKGTTSEGGEVKVEVHAGATVGGSLVATAVAHPSSAGEWSAGAVSSSLTTGEYTAVAVQESVLGNGPGKSEPVTFVVDTEAPKVSLEGPPALTTDNTPSFKGSASEAGTVTVRVHKGATVSGSEVAKVTGTVSGGKWSATVSSELADGEYTAQASEPSSLGNGEGSSNTVTFVIDTAAPTLTLEGPKSPSGQTKPSFKGTTSEGGEVTVEIYAGATASGSPVSTAVAHPSVAGAWSSGAAGTALVSGEYTAVAVQESGLGNGLGKSSPVTFIVNTAPPSVSLQKPLSPSKNTKPSFTGMTSEGGEVKVEIYVGPSVSGAPVSTAVAHPSVAGAWSSGAAGTALVSGEYTAVAVQESALGNGPGASEPVTFEVDTEAPKVSLEGPAALTTDNTPSFKGSASEAGTVTVHVHQGATVSGNEVAKVSATVSGGKWSATVGSELADGEYTAQASEPSLLGNGEGVSPTVSFVVDTKAPALTLEAPVSPSKDTTPAFGGTTSEAGEVKVEIHAGSVTGTIVATAVAHAASAGKWSSGAASPALVSGEYTAVAVQESGLGNGVGKSSPVKFVVNTAPPSVVLEAPVSPSKNTKPTFKGTTSEGGEVKVEVHAGATVGGSLVATAVAHPSSAGEWSAGAVSSALTTGEYTAVAVQKSALGNGPGTSEPVTFEVNTEAPKVSLEGPPALTTDNTPSFKGSASEAGTVTVRVHKGATVSGSEVAKVTGTVSGGKWSATVSSELADGEYTAQASEPSSLGNGEGSSNTVTFVIDTAAPTLTLEGPKSPSGQTKPSFKGTTSEGGEVTVEIYAGATASGSPVSTAVAHPSVAGAWSSGAAGTALVSGEYTAVAVQESGLGNGLGKSSPVTFIVNTAPPSVSLQKPLSPSKNTKPSFTGMTSEGGEVKVEIYVGPSVSGAPIATAVAHPTSAGEWTSAAASPALVSGEYTAQAVQVSALGNGPGTSNAVTFEVNTEPPQVTLNQLASPSKVTAPRFSGTASEAGEVTVRVF